LEFFFYQRNRRSFYVFIHRIFDINVKVNTPDVATTKKLT